MGVRECYVSVHDIAEIIRDMEREYVAFGMFVPKEVVEIINIYM